MPHRCVHCGRMYPAGSKELLEGCSECGGHFFFYIRDEQLKEIRENLVEIPTEEIKHVEKEIREMAGIIEEDVPVILDIESVRVTGDGKFEIDLVNLFNKKRPLIYKVEEGKYIIDLASTLQQNVKDLKEIKNPDEK
ncbi:MAG: Zn-ribbon containing protein [Candidatus Nanoarchaeia archaeon]|nr:Zn-ribbon containing protein [Candidatus Nanoarchaeia archaeon]MDD5357674.1 Zn-ribbon containing protein [Candidatus Nanoarchaeia archaeon]MDD5588593.1 Zn-ribbon containing protein [Candidatus Nanoarchaeia archaeon]